MNIIEGNKLIMSFMGKKLAHWTSEDSGSWISARIDLSDGFGCFNNYDELKYNTSWSWLMSVVEKIESLDDIQVMIANKGCIITKWENAPITMFSDGKFIEPRIIVDERGNSKKESVWLAVVKFIEMYNKK